MTFMKLQYQHWGVTFSESIIEMKINAIKLSWIKKYLKQRNKALQLGSSITSFFHLEKKITKYNKTIHAQNIMPSIYIQ